MVYQEQIMQISMAMSGFSAGKADKLRKAMGKKKLDVMRTLQEDWNKGAVENGYYAGQIAQQIWADAEKFAKYAFNKSHSAAYAILVMRTAYHEGALSERIHGSRAVQLHGQYRHA